MKPVTREEMQITARQWGKSEAMRLEAERHLDAGGTVYDARAGELRGAGTAKDVTPKQTLIEQHAPKEPSDD